MNRVLSAILVLASLFCLLSCNKHEKRDDISIDIIGKWIIEYPDNSYVLYDFQDNSHLKITTSVKGTVSSEGYTYSLTNEDGYLWMTAERENDANTIKYCIQNYKGNSMGLTSHPMYGSDYYPLTRL